MRKKNTKTQGFLFDILSPDIKFNISGGSSVRSKFGTCLSLVYITISSLLAFSITYSYFDTSNPGLTEEIIPSKYSPIISVKDNKLFHIVFFTLDTLIPLKAKQVSEYVSVKFSYRRYPLLEGADKYEDIIKSYDLVDCKELVDAGRLDTTVVDNEGEVKNAYYNEGMCVDMKGDDKVLGKEENRGLYESLQLEVYPCNLATNCQPQAEINRLFFSIVNPTAYFNKGRYKDPVQYVSSFGEAYSVIDMFSILQTITITQSNVYEDRGFLMPKKFTQSFTNQFEKTIVYN